MSFTTSNSFISLVRILAVVCTALGMYLIGPILTEAATVTLNPGDSIQNAVNANPNGTTFLLNPGIYRDQSVVPKDGDIFDGQGGAVLNGSRLLTGWVQSGSTWKVTGQTQQAGRNGDGECQSGFPRCAYPEDVYMDNVPLRHVDSLAAVGPGKYFFDYNTDTIYIGDNPSGHTVETAITARAFGGNATGVTVKNMTIEKYATQMQYAVIDSEFAPNWAIQGNTIQLNHGEAVNAGPGAQVLRNKMIKNGQMGYSASGGNWMFDHNEIGQNGYAGPNYYWEAGGGKVTGTTNGTVSNNCVYSNQGPGIWMDEGGDNVLVDSNVVWDNWDNGIMYEISIGGVIRNNIVGNNGSQSYGTGRQWFWSPQILLAASDNVQVYNNTIDVDLAANAITLVDQGRLRAPAEGNAVHNNTVNLRRTGASLIGIVCDGCGTASQTYSLNPFDHNSYHVASLSYPYWSFGDQSGTLSQIQAIGKESGSAVDGNLPAKPAYNCAFLGTVGAGTVSTSPPPLPPPTSPPPPPPPPAAPTATISASPTSITSGQSTMLSWGSTNATTCTGTNFTANSAAGALSVQPTVTTTFSVNCTGTGGSASASVQVLVGTVSPPPPPPPPTTSPPPPSPNPAPSPTPSVTYKFKVGDRVKTTARLRVRSSPRTTAQRLGTQAVGALGTIVDGPVMQGGYTWWKINYDTGPDGWSVENYLSLVSSAVPSPVPPPETTPPPPPPAATPPPPPPTSATTPPASSPPPITSGPTPVTYWKFDEGSGVTVADSSSGHNDGTLSSGTSWTTGKFGQALLFDNGGDKANLSASSMLDSANFTMSFWLKVNGWTSNNYENIVAGREVYLQSGFRFGFQNGSYAPMFWTAESGGTIAMTPPSPISLGTYHHITVTYDNSVHVAKLYVDGVKTIEVSGTYRAPVGQVFALGSAVGGQPSFNGSVDEVRWYDQALSDAQIQAIYSGTVALSEDGNAQLAAAYQALATLLEELNSMVLVNRGQ